jgi:hypothetical protein
MITNNVWISVRTIGDERLNRNSDYDENDKKEKVLYLLLRKNYSVNIEGYSMTLLILSKRNWENSSENRWNM